MASQIKYGHYWISAGILVAGALWLSRPGDKRILGEDLADLFEATQEVLVVPYLTGAQVPDWEAYNDTYVGYGSNSISSVIRYRDISTMAGRIRYTVTRSDGPVYWTEESFGDTAELAVSSGSYAEAESTGITVDELNGGGWAITNLTYSYTANIFADSIVTTASRMLANNSQFEAEMPIDLGTDAYNTAIASTNLPLADLIFDRGAAVSLEDDTDFNTPGSWWPFEWSYRFGWEQWSYPGHSRVAVKTVVADGVVFTNVIWIAAAGDVSVEPEAGTAAGAAVIKLYGVSGVDSAEMAYVRTPPDNNNLYLSSYYKTKTFTGSDTTITIDVLKGADAKSSVLSAVIIGGKSDVSIYKSFDTYDSSKISFSFALPLVTDYSVIRFSSEDTNHPPVYAVIGWTNNVAALSNSSFKVDSRYFIDAPCTADIYSPAVASSFTALDDRRIVIDKLDGLSEVLTNLNRTVYIGAASVLSCTGLVQVVESHAYTNYVTVFLSGSGTTPSYYTAYTVNDLIDDFLTITQTETNQTAATSVGDMAGYYFQLYDSGFADIQTDSPPSSWSSLTEVEGDVHWRKHNTWLGVSPTYPSLWAITNGYVSNVTVYAAWEVVKNITDGYEAMDVFSTYYSHDVGGEYWHEGNFGVTVDGMTINDPSHAVDATRTKGVHRVFPSGNAKDGNFWFTDTAVFSKIFTANNPTGPIVFDLPCPAVTHADPKDRYQYFSWSDEPDGSYRVARKWDYRVGYLVKVPRVLIVVDWNFQHLVRGFTPVTNTPEGR
jgi:hypothetical protein